MDNSDSPEVMTVLPKELRLGAPPTMPQARSYLFRQQSTLSSYNPEDQIQINIPRLQRSYLSKESYLQFRLNGQYKPGVLKSGSNPPVYQFAPDLFLDDAGAWSLFERMEVFDYLGSTVLETTEALPQLISLLIDMGPDFTDPQHEGATAHGLGESYIATSNNDSSATPRVLANATIGTPVTIDAQSNQFSVTIDGTTTAYTVPSGTYATTALWLTAFQNFLATTAVNTGITADLNAAGTGIDLYRESGAFTLNAPTNHVMSKLGIAAPYTFPKASVSQGVDIVSTSGVGKNFFCGGIQLAGNGTTRTLTERTFSVQFSIPLPSFLGFLSKKMAPLHNGFTIVLTIASKFKPMFIAPKQVPVMITVPRDPTEETNIIRDVKMDVMNSIEPRATHTDAAINAPTNFNAPETFWWQITDVQLVCQILELGPIAESMILSSTQGSPLIVHSKQFRNYRGAVGATAAEFYLPLNLNVSSLTNILWFMRPDGTENDLSYASVGARCRNHLQRWEFQYGSTVLPQSQGIQSMYMTNPVAPSGITLAAGTGWYNGFTECFSELIKARPCNPFKGRLNYLNYKYSEYQGKGNIPNFGFTPWRCNSGLTGDSSDNVIPKFACGLNLELAPGKSDLICGLNTNGMNTQIRGYFHPSLLVQNNKFASAIDAYAEYDAFINISPGIATTVSF